MSRWKIHLEEHEMLAAVMAGALRQIENLRPDLNRKPAYGAEDRAKGPWQLNIEGCLTELAVAKALGIYWEGKGTFRGPDVGNFQIRSSEGDHHKLILHKKDADDKAFILIVGSMADYRLAGWLWGREGKNDRWWDKTKPTPAYFIPQGVLHQMERLPGLRFLAPEELEMPV